MSDQSPNTNSSEMETVSRRDFIKIGSAIAATAGAISTSVVQPCYTQAASANAKIRIVHP